MMGAFFILPATQEILRTPAPARGELAQYFSATNAPLPGGLYHHAAILHTKGGVQGTGLAGSSSAVHPLRMGYLAVLSERRK